MENRDNNPFQSFWMAGYECSDQLNAFGNRVDLLEETEHDVRILRDYQDLKIFGIKTVREGIRWSKVEKHPYQYDFQHLIPILHASAHTGVQVVWDICHFGYPDDLTPLHPMFPRRFAAVCRAFLEFLRQEDSTHTPIITPINEVSFISWLGGEANGTSPYCSGFGWEVKYKLMKAYIEGIEAILEVNPSTRILSTEPLINITGWIHDPELHHAGWQHNNQFQVLDILSGRICPELRGREEYVDIIGLNFYFNNQWIHHPYETIGWNERPPHPLWRDLSSLVEDVYQRYHKPIIISETSHPLEDRPRWIKMIGREASKILDNNIPFWGVCLYPIIDRPDWDHLHDWHKSGLWDIYPPDKTRILYQPYAEALLRVMTHLRYEKGIT